MTYRLFYTGINGVAVQLHILYKSYLCHRQGSFQQDAYYIFVSATQNVFNVSAFCIGIFLKGLNNLN